MTEKLSDISPYLYHYTNEQGLYGILNGQKEQCLWATHFNFLNDASEIEIAKTKLKTCLFHPMLNFLKQLNGETKNLQSIASTGNLENMAKSNCEEFVNSGFRQMFPTGEIYVTSFCALSNDNTINNNGLLSQWRAYGGDGGYVLVFNTSALEELLNKEYESFQYLGFIMGDIIYSDDENKFREELSDSVRKISSFQSELFKNSVQEINNLPDLTTQIEAFQAFARFITHYKHYGFKEEHEVRIISMPHDLNDKPLKPEKERKFRNKNGVQVPYIELFGSLDKKLPIEKIIVGPHKDTELRASALKIMLRKTDIEVTASDIPYIG